MTPTHEKTSRLVEALHFAQKVERSLDLLRRAYEEYGSALVVANSLGKDSMVLWHLAKQVSKDIQGFCVTTRFKPKETVAFMFQVIKKYPEIRIFSSSQNIPDRLYETDPTRCCQLLKVEPIRDAIEVMKVKCWATGLRCTEGRTRTNLQEIEERDEGLIKLNPILTWEEREIWQYTAIHQLMVNPLYTQGYRSLGCEPCTKIVAGGSERVGRWLGTSKCGGECGIHTNPLKGENVDV